MSCSWPAQESPCYDTALLQLPEVQRNIRVHQGVPFLRKSVAGAESHSRGAHLANANVLKEKVTVAK